MPPTRKLYRVESAATIEELAEKVNKAMMNEAWNTAGSLVVSRNQYGIVYYQALCRKRAGSGRPKKVEK